MLLQCVAVCCSVLQCVAVCCSVLQCVAVCFEVDLMCSPRFFVQSDLCVQSCMSSCSLRRSTILCSSFVHTCSHRDIDRDIDR